MKKPFSTSSAFAFLFVMAAVTPQSVWASNICEFKGRSPASDEQINCLKEEKDRLEKDMKKLVEDKEKIVKQLDELKSSNKENSEDKSEDKAEKKGKKVVAENRDQDMAEMMSYISYIMVSQQEQQMAVLNQMYSFMTQSMQSFVYSQPQYDFGYGNQQARWNPYTLEGVGEMGYHHARHNQYSFDFGNGAGIGIGMNGQSFYQNPYSQREQQDFVKTPYRYPAQIPNQLERSQLIAPPPMSGYDFNPAAPMQSQQPQPQFQEPVYRPQQMDRKPPLEA